MKKRVSLIGIGMGTIDGMTKEAGKRLESAQLFIGAKRMLEVVSAQNVHKAEEYRVPQIVRILTEENDWQQACILLSGDSGFFSGAKKLLKELSGYEVEVLPGISSISYFCSRLQIAWDEVCIASLHGVQMNLIARIVRNRYTFCLLGGNNDLTELCDKLLFYRLADVILSVGEMLGYPEEVIDSGTPAEIREREYGTLISVVIENKTPEAVSGFLPDTAWIRGKVPMTKAEVRFVSLGKLDLKPDSVFYDIGAGTGSIGISAALMYPDSKVYAIERKEEAVRLIRDNIQKMKADNVVVCEGEALSVMEGLPVPTHAFIGGSGGSLEAVVHQLLEKNPKIRMVINVITLESLTIVTKLLKELSYVDSEIVQLHSAVSKEIGSYHMMEGQNPVTVITIQGKL